MNLTLFFGDSSDATARIYARFDRPREGLAGLTLSGQVVGPFCLYANTLPAHVPLIDKGLPLVDKQTPKGGGDSLLAEAIVPDPCFWTPELPFLYRVQVELRRSTNGVKPAMVSPGSQGEVVETIERPLGIRRLGVRGRDLFFEGKRFVVRAVSSRREPNAAELADYHDLATALCIANPSDALCEAASQAGVLIVAEVLGDLNVQLRRLARWPAVGIVVIETGAIESRGSIDAGIRAAAPNLLLARRGADSISTPVSIRPWPQLVLCEAADLTPSPLRGEGRDQPRTADLMSADRRAIACFIENCNIPVLVQRRLTEPLPLAAARAACDHLQADLARVGDFAGYLV